MWSNKSKGQAKGSYSSQYRRERNRTTSKLEIELVPEVSLLNAADHIVVEKVSPVLCIIPYWTRTRYVHGILLDNDPMSDMFLKVALYERKGKKERCSIVDILKFTSSHNLYRVIYDESTNLKSGNDVISISTFIANNPSHLEYHEFSNSEDFALFCKIEWARTNRENVSYRGEQENEAFFWDEDIDPLSNTDRSHLLTHDEL